jgi:phosphatidylserine/phosphatidylglycerophosphate/cardiolipin synthase-like enzyme
MTSSRTSTADGVAYVDGLRRKILGAQHRLWLKVPWIGPIEGAPLAMLSAVREVHDRGADVRVLLRSEASNTAVLQSLASWGVPHRTVRFLHEKEMLVDGRLTVFSANFTPPELGRNDNHSYA